VCLWTLAKKTDKVAEDWTAGGNEFQMTDAATGNERRPMVVRRYSVCRNVQQKVKGRSPGRFGWLFKSLYNMDDTIFYATSQSELLPIDLGAGA